MKTKYKDIDEIVCEAVCQHALDYPNIFKLNIPIHREGRIEYVLGEDIKKKLTKEQSDKFDEYFGVQTCLRTKEGKSGLYLWDVDSCLARIFTGKLEGSQLNWD